MESEKVKEIKKALECWQESVMLSTDENYVYHRVTNREILNYINELEGENKKLKDIGLNEEITVAEYLREMQRLKDRVAELEEYIEGNEQDAKAFVNGWRKDLETELKQFATLLKVKTVLTPSGWCVNIEDIDEALKERIK